MTRRSRSLVRASACASKLKALADPTRLAVVEALMDGPKHAGALQERLKVEQTLLSHHLQSLREAKLVVAERDGKAVLYRLAPGVAARRGESAIDLGCCMLSFTRQPPPARPVPTVRASGVSAPPVVSSMPRGSEDRRGLVG